jgi:hypothetical protein
LFALFLSDIFFVEPISQWLLRSFILLGNNSLPLLGLPTLLTFLKTCLKLTIVRPPQRQLPLRSSFVPTHEEEPAIWFRLIEAQFAAADIQSLKLRYANALASLPK